MIGKVTKATFWKKWNQGLDPFLDYCADHEITLEDAERLINEIRQTREEQKQVLMDFYNKKNK